MSIEEAATHQRNELSHTSEYSPEKMAERCNAFETDHEKQVYIDLLKELDAMPNDEIEDHELSEEQIGALRYAVIVKDRTDVLWTLEQSLYKLNRCLCSGCERTFTKTEEERKSSFCPDRAALEHWEVSKDPNLIQLHVCCKSCREK